MACPLAGISDVLRDASVQQTAGVEEASLAAALHQLAVEKVGARHMP